MLFNVPGLSYNIMHNVHSCNGSTKFLGYAKKLRLFRQCKMQETELSVRNAREKLKTDKRSFLGLKIWFVDVVGIEKAMKVIT